MGGRAPGLTIDVDGMPDVDGLPRPRGESPGKTGAAAASSTRAKEQAARARALLEAALTLSVSGTLQESPKRTRAFTPDPAAKTATEVLRILNTSPSSIRSVDA